jgi:hypothetical protein
VIDRPAAVDQITRSALLEGVFEMKSRLPFVIIFSSVVATGCQRSGPEEKRPQPGPSSVSPQPLATAEQWASKPPREWPQLVLTNRAEFNGHTPLQGASAFFLKTQDGRMLAATARHLIGANGGVKPEISVATLNGAIRSWHMYPRTLPGQFVLAEKIGASGLDNENLDWLILTIKDTGKALPATPLQLRRQPVQVGEQVYLVGCPYVEEACKQNVYAGKVTARAGDRFRYDIDPPVDIRGFSGAPVIDRNGHVVGVMTVWFEPKMQGERFLEAGGEDAASVYQLVERRR